MKRRITRLEVLLLTVVLLVSVPAVGFGERNRGLSQDGGF